MLTPDPSKADFAALSEFRYQIRRFERFSENAAQAEGITPLQYLLLLHIKGYPERDWATVGELAERLQAQQHGSLIGLVLVKAVSRLIALGSGTSGGVLAPLLILERVPVVADAADRQLVGVVSRSDLIQVVAVIA